MKRKAAAYVGIIVGIAILPGLASANSSQTAHAAASCRTGTFTSKGGNTLIGRDKIVTRWTWCWVGSKVVSVQNSKCSASIDPPHAVKRHTCTKRLTSTNALARADMDFQPRVWVLGKYQNAGPQWHAAQVVDLKSGGGYRVR